MALSSLLLGYADRAAVLLGAVDPVRVLIVDGEVVEAGGGLIVDGWTS